jgi:hypothetical protein
MRTIKIMKVVVCLVLLALMWTWVYAGEENVISKKSNVTFGGRLHAQFQTSNSEEAKDGDEPSSTFSVRRARLAASYKNESGKIKGKVQYDLGEGGAKLKDGYIDASCCPHFAIRMGQFKKPFSLWELTSTTKTMVIERGNAVIGSSWKATNQIIGKDGRYSGRDIGAMVHGKTEKVDYAFGVFNGNGDNKKADDDKGKTFGGRLVLKAMPGVRVGGSVSSRTISCYDSFVDTTKNGESASFTAFEVDLDFGIGPDVSQTGPWLQAEVATGNNPHFDDETDFMGVTVVGSFNLRQPEGGKIYSIRPAVRVDYAQRHKDDDDFTNMLITPGIDIFFDKYNRLQINVDMNKPKMDGADSEVAVRVQGQIHI